MDVRELEALKHLQTYCYQLYQFRLSPDDPKSINKWLYDGSNGPTEQEVQIMVEAYYSNVPKSERETNPIFNRKRLFNSRSPDFLLEIKDRIDAFIRVNEAHLDEVDETIPDANIIGPAVVFAYEKHLQEVRDRQQAKTDRVAGQKVKIPKVGSLYDHLAVEESTAHNRVIQAGFSQSIAIERKGLVGKVENIILPILADPIILGSLPEDQRKTIARELGDSLITNPEITDKETYLEQQLAGGETYESLLKKKSDRENPLPEADRKKLKIKVEDDPNVPPVLLLTQAILRTTVKLQEMAQRGQMPADKVVAITEKIREKRLEVEPLLPEALRLQSLSVASSSPEASKLYYQQSFTDSYAQTQRFISLLSPNLSNEEHNLFTSAVYSRLRENLLRNPRTPLILTDGETFKQAFSDAVIEAIRKDPFIGGVELYKLTIPNIRGIIDANPDILLSFRAHANAAFSVWNGPETKDKKIALINERILQQCEVSINQELARPYRVNSLFGELSQFEKALIIAQGPNGTKALLKYFENPSRSDLSPKEIMLIEKSNIQSLDIRQIETVKKLLDFLNKHPKLNRLLVLPAQTIVVPGLKAGIEILINDPSYVAQIPKYIWMYEWYFVKLGVKEGIALGELRFRIPFTQKYLFRLNILRFRETEEKLLAKIATARAKNSVTFFLKFRLRITQGSNKLWNFLWAENRYHFHTFLFANPKEWLKVKVTEKIRLKIISSLKYGLLKKAKDFIKQKTFDFTIKLLGKKIGEWVFKKVTTSLLTRALGAIIATAIGFGTVGVGWIAAIAFVYSIIRELVPFFKDLEKFILAGIGMIFYGAFSLLTSLFSAIGGFIGSAVGAVSSLVSGLTTSIATGIGGGAAGVGVAALGGVAGITMISALATNSSFVDYQKNAAPIYYSSCGVKDIHNLGSITPENKAIFVSKFKALFPNSLLESKIDEVIFEAKKVGFNPALAVAIWGEESHFSNYGSAGGEENVAEGYDFGCGVYCTDTKPKNYAESLACFVGKNGACSDSCLNKPNFKEFMECYGPASENPYFISNTISIFKELVTDPNAIECSGGTTGQFASQLINHLLSCYNHGGVINDTSFTDGGQCLRGQGVPAGSVSFVAGSVQSYHSLQCVGFAMAVEAGTGAGNGFTRGGYENAKEYYRETPGYQVIPKSAQNVVIGDLAFFDGASGHVAVVIDTAPDMSWFRVAQAIGINTDGSWYGLVNESDRIPITWSTLLGFLRRN